MTYETIIFLVVFIKVAASIENPILELPTGKILGRETTTTANTSYYVFEKIPYATPPLGPLRFKAPQLVEPWDGILNTTYLDISCYQQQGDWPSDSSTDSEDCLFVNVYTPALPGNDENVSFPVMLFIHGGAFAGGRALDYNPDLFVDNEVILVTISYRLGIFGFLSTGDEVIPGNNGLKDQRLAIQWAHENIHLFGGDSEKITIFGESAGSVSVAYQLLNQNSEGLFSGAILESGTFLCQWTLQRNPRKIAFETAGIINSTFLTSNDSSALLDYLQSVDAEDLDAAAEQHLQNVGALWDYDIARELIYAPVIEVKSPDAFLTKKMYGLLQAGNILKVPVIVGMNSEEILLYNQDPAVLQTILETFDNNLDLLVPKDMQIVDSEEHAEMAKSIRDIYTSGEPFGTRLGASIRYSSDNAFNRAIVKFAELFSAFGETYFYQFSYDGTPGNISIYYEGAEHVGHTEELAYLFCVTNLGCSFSDFTESDIITSQRVIKLWTNFAKYRNPTPEVSELLQNITWPKLSTANGDFLYLDIDEDLEIRNHPKAEAIKKWNNLYDGLNFTDFDTY